MLEGVAFGLRDGLDLMIAAGMPAPAQIRASGGGTASPLWRQILADVLEAEIATVNTTEGAAFGAACWRRSARAGSRRSRRPPTRWSRDAGGRTRARTRPATRSSHARYRELYPALRPPFPRACSGVGPPPSRYAVELGAAPLSETSSGLLAHDDHRRGPRPW